MAGAEEGYTLVDHTGDIALLVRGHDIVALFEQAAAGLFAVIVDPEAIEARASVPVAVEGAVDTEDLLVRFLSELLFLNDARDWLFREVSIGRLEGSTLEAVARGETYDPARHAIERQVKAVTYHRLHLQREPEGWSATIVLDL